MVLLLAYSVINTKSALLDKTRGAIFISAVTNQKVFTAFRMRTKLNKLLLMPLTKGAVFLFT